MLSAFKIYVLNLNKLHRSLYLCTASGHAPTGSVCLFCIHFLSALKKHPTWSDAFRFTSLLSIIFSLKKRKTVPSAFIFRPI